MITKTDIDEGRTFDWGKTSPDYAVYRPGYPASFYTVLQAVGSRQIAPDTFTILHQVWLHAYTPIGDVDVVQASLS